MGVGSCKVSPMPDALTPTPTVDSDHPVIVSFAEANASGARDARERAVKLYYGVRDCIRYDPYSLRMTVPGLRASSTVEAGRGWCVTKAVLLAACCLLARLHRHSARREMGQGHSGVQRRALRQVPHQATGVRWHRRFDLSPIRSRRPPAHGISPVSRRVRRPATRRNHGVLREALLGDDGRNPHWRFRPRGRPGNPLRAAALVAELDVCRRVVVSEVNDGVRARGHLLPHEPRQALEVHDEAAHRGR